jgi:hypothetical protein
MHIYYYPFAPVFISFQTGVPIDPSTRLRQGFGGQAAFTTEPDDVSFVALAKEEVSGRAG